MQTRSIGDGLDAAGQQQRLHDAIESRKVVGEAIGPLRAKTRLSSNETFDLLANASQRTNLDMRDLAQQIADGSRTGNEPPQGDPNPKLGPS